MNTVVTALASGSSSVRLQAALAAGTTPDPDLIDTLVERCAVEPDFYVRDMLTWAITRLPAESTVPRLVAELSSARPQARSQALHSLSKIGDRAAWPALTRELLTDTDGEVARAAWRTAAGLVPDGAEAGLAAILVTQLGRGDRETRLSLSRALIMLGEAGSAALPLDHDDPVVRQHALATEQLFQDPDAGFDFGVDQAIRIVALGPSETLPAERAG
ncbi:HEAT repeat domain-containing protein [Actinoplanes sp. G11-F43]|uniref:HEAT repeat domain-containing protein n=1 Tax=Actinoplanes sp. G11-F43 TaxID=3424130 RepID=UPI003D32552F